MTTVPTDIRALAAERQLHVTWHDGEVGLPFRHLRAQCECAHCVNEWTGERILDPDSIPEDVGIEKMELVGNYAVRIYWSDGHHSGLFTWERLRELSGEL